ncbi:MAG: gliding motility-associated C-terminal domain-containing protein [Bacteroidetes bacterium]|nr:gliding motility-associated C-terminal domain-containing protein [Bacteroidota bacterium]
MFRKALIFICILFPFISFSQENLSNLNSASVINAFVNKPVFRKNAGQYDCEIKYRLSSGKTSIAFYENKVQFGIRKAVKNLNNKLMKKNNYDLEKLEYVIWEMEFENQNKNSCLLSQNKINSKITRFAYGCESATEIEEFEKLIYKNIYNNIDLVFYLDKESNLKYDFIVNPGGNYNEIKLKYNGLNSLQTDKIGNLIIETPWNEKIKEGKPIAWQITSNGKIPVEINYSVSENVLSYYSKENIQPNATLVIDPLMLDWSSYFYGKNVGTSTWGWTYVLDMDIDKDNNVYVTGMTSESFPTKVGTYDTSMGSTTNYEGFIAKMSLNADSLLLFTYIGGSSWEYTLSIAVNQQEQPVISGLTMSADFPITSNAYDKNGGAGYRGFITKISKDFKTLIFSTYFGKANTSWNVIQSMAVAANGDVLFTGQTNANDFPVTTGCLQNTYAGGSYDGFLTRMSADGSKLIYSTFFGGTGNDISTDLSLNANEDVYLVGSTSNSNFPLTTGAKGPFKYTNSDAMDGWVAKIQYDGKKLLWSKMMGGSNLDYFEGLYVNSNDELYIAGYSNSGDFYTTTGVVQPTSKGGYDHVIVKMNKAGTNIYFSTYLGGSGDDFLWAGYWWNSNIRIAANVKDEAIIGGVTKSQNYPVTTDALQTTNHAKSGWATNLAISKLSYDGSKQLYGTYFGGSYWEYPTSLKVKKISCMSSILYGGVTLSDDYPTTKGVYHEKGKSSTGFAYSGFISRFRDTLYTEPIEFKDNIIECDNVYEVLDAKNRGADYLWSDGSKKKNLIVTDTGLYWVRATYGCDTVSDTIRFYLKHSPKPKLPDDSLLCNNSAGIFLDALNDSIDCKYLWNTNDTSQLIKVTKPGLYKVNISTTYCGSITDSTDVKFLKIPDIINFNDSIFCDSIYWLATADTFGFGTIYKWSTGDTTFSTFINKSGNYKLKISNYCGIDSTEIKVSKLLTPSVNLGNDTIICDNISLKFKVGKPDNDEIYFWYDVLNNNGFGIKDTFTFKSAGVLGISVKNKCGTALDSINIKNIFTPVINLGNDTVYCGMLNKNIIIGKTSNDETYLWNTSNTSNNQNITNSGKYWAIIKNICKEVSDTIIFTQKLPLKLELGNDTVFCNSISKSINILQTDPSVVYKWHDGSDGTSYIASKPEKITASITNLCGTVTDSVTYSLISDPQVNLGSDLKFCDVVKPVTINIGKTANDEKYLWNDNNSTNSNTLSNPGKYWVEIKNKCKTVSDTINVFLSYSPEVFLGKDTSLCGNINLMLDAQNTGCTYLWFPGGETTQKIFADKQTIYKVSVTNADGCTGNDEFEINDDCKSYWYIPNSFSPNGDGLNDKYLPSFINCENYTLKIYNRWGEVVFETNDITEGWDGMYHGKPMAQDNYVYFIHFKSSEDKKWYKISGSVLLLQ